MNLKNKFRGLGIALITPFKANGQVDFDKLEELTEYQICNGADFLCVLGTTAETPCLSEFEKRNIIETIIRINAGRLPLVVGAGSNCTQKVINYISNEIPHGIDAVLLVAPYYNKPSQEGIYQHFKTISKTSKVPIILYNVPGRTGVNIDADTTLRIARECPNIIGIKEASGNISQIKIIIEKAPNHFNVLSGDDAITFDLLALGAKGVISVIGNAYPKTFSELVHANLEGNIAHSLELHERFSVLYPLLSVDGNPSGIKCLLSIQNKIQNILRLPLTCVRDSTKKAILDFTTHFLN